MKPTINPDAVRTGASIAFEEHKGSGTLEAVARWRGYIGTIGVDASRSPDAFEKAIAESVSRVVVAAQKELDALTAATEGNQ